MQTNFYPSPVAASCFTSSFSWSILLCSLLFCELDWKRSGMLVACTSTTADIWTQIWGSVRELFENKTVMNDVRSALLILFFFTPSLLKFPTSIKDFIFSFWPKLQLKILKKNWNSPHGASLHKSCEVRLGDFSAADAQKALYGTNFCEKNKIRSNSTVHSIWCMLCSSWSFNMPATKITYVCMAPKCRELYYSPQLLLSHLGVTFSKKLI